MERLTKKELRALLEFIKECYPICDLETFRQRVVSRLSKIVSAELISHNGVKPRSEWSAYLPHSTNGYTLSKNEIFEQRVRAHPVITHRGKTRDTTQRQFHRLGSHNEFYRHLGEKNRLVPGLIRESAVNCKTKNLAVHDKILLKLVSPHLNQAYRNAQTFTHMQQKLSLVDQALYRLNVGFIFLKPNGRIRLATTWAMRQLTSYLGPQSLREDRLPELLSRWVKQQEVALNGKDDILLQQDPLVMAREGKRLVIHLVFDSNQSLLTLEEHPTTLQLHSPVRFGLSPREAQVLGWVSQGKTNKEIGVILELSPRTVQKHLEHIYQKIGVESRTAAAVKAYEIASIGSKPTANFALLLATSLIT
jgi:DNA-binding CsgD family transcriptional regulator